jgi:hypothetical protein
MPAAIDDDASAGRSPQMRHACKDRLRNIIGFDNLFQWRLRGVCFEDGAISSSYKVRRHSGR